MCSSSNSVIGCITIRPTRVNGGLCFERSSLHARRVETLTPIYSAASRSLTCCLRALGACDGTGNRETTASAILAASAVSSSKAGKCLNVRARTTPDRIQP